MPGVSASIEPNRLYNSRTRHENPRYRVAVRRLDFLLDTLLDFLLDTAEDGRPTLADRKPRVFAHASQRSTRNGLTALLLSSTYFEHRSTLSHWLHFWLGIYVHTPSLESSTVEFRSRLGAGGPREAYWARPSMG
jgi:hypothetical protein